MTVSGTANYVTTYSYDAANRLLSENRTGDGSSETRYTYDADGNLLTRTVTSVDGIASATYQYDLLGQLVLSNEAGIQAAYAYNVQGIRTEKTTSNGWTQYLLDGRNVIGEQTDAGLVTYLRGVNLILRTDSAGSSYYLFNAHGDVTELTGSSGAVTKTYRYDAFGVETSPDPQDENPFRYCGEYFDVETGKYYLRARYYDPDIGRFTQQDTHWNTANSIYGDNPQKINEREDKLGLKTYSYAPQITAVMQSGNLYVYCGNSPVQYQDTTGAAMINIVFAAIGAIAGWAFGDYVASNLGLEGWKYWTVRGAVTVGGAAIGWFTGAAVAEIAKDFLLSNPTILAKIPTLALSFLGIQVTEPVGQFHHVLSNPIMKALDAHPTLAGLFDRNSSIVQALTEEAHRGYQTWHRIIDQTMVAWLQNPANSSATPNQFWTMLYSLYNTPEMIERFGRGVLNYIKEMMR